MLSEKLINSIVKETIKNGGYSQVKNKRFMVAIPNHEKIININDFSNKTISDYIKDNLNVISDKIGLGTWLNNDKVYLDLSIGIDDLKQAIDFAKSSNQLAIYDTVENVEITI